MNTPSTNSKLRPQPALASLTDAEREQVADWLRYQTFVCVQDRIARPRERGGFDLIVSISVLQRLRARTATLQQINDQLEDKQNLTDLLAAQNGEKVNWSEGTHELVQRAAFNIALLPDQTPSRLVSLMRIANHPHCIAMDHHQKNIAERNTAVREAHLKLAEQKLADSNSKLSTKNSTLAQRSDHLGPFARNWDEVGERARKAFGITPEESARRAELRRTWVDPSAHLNTPAPAPDPDPSYEPPNSPVSCQSDVADVARASSACAAPAHKSSTVLASSSGTVPVPGRTDSSEQAPLSEISISETNNPTAPSAPSNPAPPLPLSVRQAEFFKGMAAHAAAALNELNARRANSNPENEKPITNNVPLITNH